MQTRCGKIEYATRGLARKALVTLRKTGRRKRTYDRTAKPQKGRDMQAYLCPYCNHWHIGHPRTTK